MESLVSHRAALESRGGGELRRSLLKGKRSHGCPPGLATANTISSCSAVGCSQAMLCLGTSKTGGGTCVRLRRPWAAAGSCPRGVQPYLGSFDLPLREQTQTGQDWQGAPPWLGGLAGRRVPAGCELCAGSSRQENQPHWKGDGRCERLCHTHRLLEHPSISPSG